TASSSVTVAPSSAPPPSTPASPVAPRTASSSNQRSATLSVTGAKTVHLGVEHPVVTLTITVSRPTVLRLTLLDRRGEKVGNWTKDEPSGKHTLALSLRPKALHVGKDELLIDVLVNSSTKKLWITLKK